MGGAAEEGRLGQPEPAPQPVLLPDRRGDKLAAPREGDPVHEPGQRDRVDGREGAARVVGVPEAECAVA